MVRERCVWCGGWLVLGRSGWFHWDYAGEGPYLAKCEDCGQLVNVGEKCPVCLSDRVRDLHAALPVGDGGSRDVRSWDCDGC